MLVILGILGFFIIDRMLAHDHGKESNSEGLLIITADLLHNLVDGIALGASYRIGPVIGITSTISIFAHELAHEIGDFAALMEFGFSLKKALLSNVLTGFANLFGAVLSLHYGSMESLQ